MNKRVLLVAYYFPPLGLAGIGRPLALFEKLSNFGYDCHILTVKNVAYRAFEPELLATLDDSKIFRSGSYDPQRLLYLLGGRKIGRTAIEKAKPASQRFFPDSKVGWVDPAIRLGRKLCKKYNYDVILSTSPPVSVHLVGGKLSRQTGIPWVADYRDYWTMRTIEDTYDDPKRIERASVLRDWVSRSAKAVVAANNAAAKYVGAQHTIMNGYNEKLANNWISPPPNDSINIGLFGHQLEKEEFERLFALLKHLRTNQPETYKRIKLVQVGDLNQSLFNEWLHDEGLDVKIVYHGRLEREETIRTLSSVHLFYFIVSRAPKADYVPYRTFDIIASGRQLIVDVHPDSETWNLVEPSGRAALFDENNVERTAGLVRSIGESIADGSYSFKPLDDFAAQYSSDAMVGRFAKLMDSIE